MSIIIPVVSTSGAKSTVTLPDPSVTTFRPSLSAFSFAEGTGSVAVSSINPASYTLTAATPSTAWSNGRAASKFSGPIGTSSPAAWSIGFTMTVTAFPVGTALGAVVHTKTPDFYWEVDSSKRISSYTPTGGSIFSGALNTGVPYSVVTTYSSTNGRRLYVNGALVATGTGATRDFGAFNVMGDTGEPFNGFVDDLRFWDVELTAAEAAAVTGQPVAAPNNPPPPPPPPGLPALWNASPPTGVCPAPSGPVVGVAGQFDTGILAQNEIWDHFNGAAGADPDSRLWVEDAINQGGYQTYNGSQTFLDGNGNVVMRAIANAGNTAWTSGRFTSRTKFNMQYGWCASRIKFPSQPSFVPAFWLLHVGFNTAPLYGEIDILEFFGRATRYSSHLHFETSPQLEVNVNVAESVGSAFHTYWMLWEPERIQTGVDDTPVATWTRNDLTTPSDWAGMQQPFYYILNLSVGRDYLSAPVASSFPSDMVVDWVWYKPLALL